MDYPLSNNIDIFHDQFVFPAPRSFRAKSLFNNNKKKQCSPRDKGNKSFSILSPPASVFFYLKITLRRSCSQDFHLLQHKPKPPIYREMCYLNFYQKDVDDGRVYDYC